MERGFSTGVHSLTVNIWHTANIRDVGRSENHGGGDSITGGPQIVLRPQGTVLLRKPYYSGTDLVLKL